MTWTFCKIKLKKFEDFPKEWVLRIDNKKDLLNYWMQTQPTVVRDSFDDLMMHPKGHFTNTVTHTVALRAEISEVSFVESLITFMDDVYKGMIKCLNANYTLYIRSCGSYTMDTVDSKSYAILETEKSDKLIFPTTEDKLKIFKWPQGKHWYATIGNVKVNGKQKWNSYDAADNAAKKFLDGRNK